jgi:hypothetical protein
MLSDNFITVTIPSSNSSHSENGTQSIVTVPVNSTESVCTSVAFCVDFLGLPSVTLYRLLFRLGHTSCKQKPQ